MSQMTAVLSSPSSQYSFSPFNEKRYESVTATPISSNSKNRKNVVGVVNPETPIRSGGRRRRNNINNIGSSKNSTGNNNGNINNHNVNNNKNENKPNSGVIEVTKGINNLTFHKSKTYLNNHTSALASGIRNIKNQQSSPSTPARQISDPDRYAGPTFHASPAPSNLPVPKFVSQSVPMHSSSSSSLQRFYESEGDLFSQSSTSVPSSPSPSKVVENDFTDHTSVSDDGIADLPSGFAKPDGEALSISPVSIPTMIQSRITRFGDSVVFKPRRRCLNSA